jgi:hypothetical protein
VMPRAPTWSTRTISFLRSLDLGSRHAARMGPVLLAVVSRTSPSVVTGRAWRPDGLDHKRGS